MNVVESTERIGSAVSFCVRPSPQRVIAPALLASSQYCGQECRRPGPATGDNNHMARREDFLGSVPGWAGSGTPKREAERLALRS